MGNGIYGGLNPNFNQQTTPKRTPQFSMLKQEPVVIQQLPPDAPG